MRKGRIVGIIFWNEIQLKEPQRQKQTQERNKKIVQARLVDVLTVTSPPKEGELAGTHNDG